MPAKNAIKKYVEGGYYHIYNRGVEKRDIFLDRDDYATFLNLLKLYLSPPTNQNSTDIKRSDLKMAYYNRKNLYGFVELLAFCLMPNHFHLLVKQHVRNGIIDLMRCLSTSYVIYFNKKNERVGALFSGKYKAVLVTEDPYLLHLSRYIHLNPKEIGKDYRSYDFSSYPDYLGKRKTHWMMPEEVLGYFGSARKGQGELKAFSSYQSFVEDYAGDVEEVLGDLVVETGR